MNFPIELTYATIIGALTLFFGVLVKVIGFPDQIRQNYKRKSTKGLSTTFIILSFFVYVLWTLHGIIQSDLVLIIGQGLGIVTTGVILIQIFYYRSSSKK